MHILPTLLALLISVAGFTDKELATALRGDIAVHTESFIAPSGKASGRGIGAVVINRPISDVWNVLSHYEDKATYQPRVEQVWVLDKSPQRLHVKMKVDASVTMILYTAWYTLDESTHKITWNLDKSATDNTVNDIEGSYQLTALSDNQTLVVYRAWVDTGRKVPQFIQNYMARQSIPKLLTAVRNRIESGGLWHK
jgi:uncharacterized membrane protein